MKKTLYSKILIHNLFIILFLSIIFGISFFVVFDRLEEQQREGASGVVKMIKNELEIFNLVDDENIFSEGLVSVVQRYPDITMVKYSKGEGVRIIHFARSDKNFRIQDEASFGNLEVYFKSKTGAIITPVLMSSIISFFVIFGYLVKVRGFLKSELADPIKEIKNAIEYYQSREFKRIQRKILINPPGNEIDPLINTTNDVFDFEVSKINSSKILNEKVIKATKAKDFFIASMAHDFKTPLVTINGILLRMKDRLSSISSSYKEIPEILQDLNLLKMVTDDMEVTTFNILDYSKIESGNELITESNRINIRKFVLDLINAFSPAITAKKLRVFYEIDFFQDLIIDDKKYQQVLRNMLGNAIKHSPAPGEIMIKFKKTSNSYLLTEVIDAGGGVSKDAKKFIFKPFEKSRHDLTEGYGIGLSFNKLYLDIIGGSIGFFNNCEKGEALFGATFYFCFPAKYCDSEQTSNTETVGYWSRDDRILNLINDAASLYKNMSPIHFNLQKPDEVSKVILYGDLRDWGDILYSEEEVFVKLRRIIRSDKIDCMAISYESPKELSHLKMLGVNKFCLMSEFLSHETFGQENPKTNINKETLNLNILVCDDVHVYSNLITDQLKDHGFKNIHQSFNGEEAVDFCTKNKVDVIFMDHMMPKMNGVVAAKIIKKKYPHILIIGFTAAKNELSDLRRRSMDKIFLKDLSNTDSVIMYIKEQFKQ